MGKAARVACIFTPYMLSIASLVCIILVGLGCTKKGSALDDLYFAKLDLKDLSTDSMNIAQDLFPLTKGLQQADAAGDIHDVYTIGLWNYCYGDYVNGGYKITTCTPRKTKFWFNPVEVWNLDGQDDNLLPKSLKNGLNSYSKAAGWLYIAYVIAFCATVAELVIGISAIFSRWGSLATTICSAVSSFFILAATVSATALYGVLIAAVNTGLKPYNIKAAFGRSMMITTWLATLFSLAAGLFWLFSVCCCSGRSPYSHDKKNKRVVVEKTPYTYERVGSPYRGSATVPAHGAAAPTSRDMAYEPFRHDQHA
jgi:hypothetical protein